MQHRDREEALEAQLLALQRDVFEAEDELGDYVAQFQDFQDDALVLAGRLGVLGPELRREFESQQREFLEVKREADQLIEGVRERCEHVRFELESLRGER